MIKTLPCIVVPLAIVQGSLEAADTFTNYTAETTPQNVTDLWKDVDARRDPLDTEVVKEWREDGIVCRYVIFKVGTFKAADSRVAAFYTFPEGMQKGPAFVWSHGGGQRAERERGTYFAKQGFATLDINWGGREMAEGVKPNTDWGHIDPSQGPRFYPGALRKGTKSNLTPDEHTIDSVPSPRNGNWFQLAYAGRRAITFLERQPEVAPDRIGFTGFSMGGTITSMVAIDKRLKAVAPMVGGSGYVLSDFPGLPGTGKARAYMHPRLYSSTIDSQSYWPLVTCPVLFLSASNDFHSTFERIYRCMDLLPHDNWRVSQKMHYSHSLGPEQWILLNRWFDLHLKGKPDHLPKTANAKLTINSAEGRALFTVKPDRNERLLSLDVYYSHDPNPRSRFWKHANAERMGDTWTAELPVRDNLPLFAFANCAYPLDKPTDSFGGPASTFTLTSREAVHLPLKIRPELLRGNARHNPVFEDFEKNGFRDWGFGPQGGISTCKFQDPETETPVPGSGLRATINAPRGRLSYRFRVTKNKYLTGVRDKQDTFFVTQNIAAPGSGEFILRASDFKNRNGNVMLDWTNISTFVIDVYDGAAKASLDFTAEENRRVVSKLEWVDE